MEFFWTLPALVFYLPFEYSHWHRGKTEKGKIFKKTQYLMNTLYFTVAFEQKLSSNYYEPRGTWSLTTGKVLDGCRKCSSNPSSSSLYGSASVYDEMSKRLQSVPKSYPNQKKVWTKGMHLEGGAIYLPDQLIILGP